MKIEQIQKVIITVIILFFLRFCYIRRSEDIEFDVCILWLINVLHDSTDVKQKFILYILFDWI